MQVSVQEAAIYSWTENPPRWMPRPPATPAHLLRARNISALPELVAEFVTFLRAGPHKTLRGALGWYVDSNAPDVLDAVALVVPVLSETLEQHLYRSGKDPASRRLQIETRVDVMLDLCDALQHLRTSGHVLLDRVGAVLTEADVRELEAVYTAPPVAAGDVVELGMDCWALGVLLWELVMGFKPVAEGQGAARSRRGHASDAAAMHHWILKYAARAMTDPITHDVLGMLLRPKAAQRCTPEDVSRSMRTLKAVVASDLYRERTAALLEGTTVLWPKDADPGSSVEAPWQACLMAAYCHLMEQRNNLMSDGYNPERLRGLLRQAPFAATPCRVQFRWPRWASCVALLMYAAVQRQRGF